MSETHQQDAAMQQIAELKVVLTTSHSKQWFKLIVAKREILNNNDVNIYTKTAHRSSVKNTHLSTAWQTVLHKNKAVYVENSVEVGAMSAEISVAVVGR